MRWTHATAGAVLALAGWPGATGLALAQPEARFEFRATPGALSKDAVPLHVALDIEPLFEADGSAARFKAEVRIRWRADATLPALELHAKDLQFDAARLDGELLPAPVVDDKLQRVRFDVPGGIARGEHELQASYRGTVGKSPDGLFSIASPSPQGIRHVLATQLEPIGARRVLPLWDEPLFRVPFEVRVVVPVGLQAISNGEIVKREALPPLSPDGPGGAARERISFAPTPAMPSYLLALFIGRFESIEDATEAPLIRIHTVPGRSTEGRLALDATRKVLREFTAYFAQPYPLPKLDQIALPGGFNGAMENWGAIAYNESLLLYDPATSPAGRRMTVWNLVAHEVAHQWFGNLVTMAWWDNLWLNEGFATWMQRRTVQRFNPDQPVWLRAAVRVDRAMQTDASAAALPVARRIDDDRAVFSSFDEITYQKGMAFIRMLEAWIGEAPFRDGLRRYMAAHAMGNATTADLWHHLEAASGKPVANIADAWVRRSGLPLVDVQSRCERGRLRVTLAQQRFTVDAAVEPRLWPIPLTLARYEAGGRLLERRSVLMQGPRGEHFLAGCAGALKANPEGAGYYRVRYGTAQAAALERVMARLPASERMNLLADSWALVLAGQVPIADWLRRVESLGAEASPEVWGMALDAIARIGDLVEAHADLATQAGWRNRIALVLATRLDLLSMQPRAGESDAQAELRDRVIGMLGRLDHAPTVAAVQALWRSAVPAGASDLAALPPTLLAGITGVVGRHADASTFEQLRRLARNESLPERRGLLWSAIGAARDPDLAQQTIAIARTEEAPAEESPWLLTNLAEAGHRELAWQALQQHHAGVTRRMSPQSLGYLAPSLLRGSGDARHATELLGWTERELGAPGLPEARKAVAAIGVNAGLVREVLPQLRRWAVVPP